MAVLLQRANGDTLDFQTALEHSSSLRVRVSQVPQEDGVVVSDHTQSVPIPFAFSATLSQVTAGPTYEEVRAFVLAVQGVERISVLPDDGILLTNMEIITFDPRQVRTGTHRVGFTMVQRTIVEAAFVEVPPLAPRADAANQAASSQNLQEQPTETQSAQNTSALYNLFLGTDDPQVVGNRVQ